MPARLEISKVGQVIESCNIHIIATIAKAATKGTRHWHRGGRPLRTGVTKEISIQLFDEISNGGYTVHKSCTDAYMTPKAKKVCY